MNHGDLTITALQTAPAAQPMRTLFSRYPYKRLQQRSQRLEGERLADLYMNGLLKAVETGAPHWAALDGQGQPVALAGLAADGWHSGAYGLKMGKVQPWLNTTRPAQAGPPLLQAVQDHARAQGFEHLAVRVDGQDFENLHLFEADGWRLIDVSLKFSLDMHAGPRPQPQAPAAQPAAAIALATAADREWICALGSGTHPGAHLLNDPALPREKTIELFSRWLKRCLDGLAYRTHVLRGPGQGEGQGLGFVTYLRSPGFAKVTGRNPIILDFVLLDPAGRGRGAGPRFIAQTLAAEMNEGFDYCELRTSAHNLPAVQCYEKLGFACCAADMLLHKSL